MQTSRLLYCLAIPTAIILMIADPPRASAQAPTIHEFERIRLSDRYFSEGISTGDLNGDGTADIICGPYWYAGPDYASKHEIYPPVPQNREGYADNFFSWVHDFDRDGWNDVFVVGFPGTPAYVYQNPGRSESDGNGHPHWVKHQVFDWVSNESPRLIDLVGDETPELVCTRDGFFGFATVPKDKPLTAWEFHAISPQVTATRFGHGLGIGDLNGDGRMDILHSKGWYEQPDQNPLSSRWPHHEVTLCGGPGGAEMYAYDVDGDGDNDVITSDSAHAFGLSWFEQIKKGSEITFKQHRILGDHPSHNRYGVLFSELHSVALADIDGDGLQDIVTGKTYWSHHRKSPMWDTGAVVYWFKLVRSEKGVDWLPYLIDDQSGIGRQVVVADLNGDQSPDIMTGGMKGAHALIQRRKEVTQEQFRSAQPQLYDGPKPPSAAGAVALRGPKRARDESDPVSGAIEGESLTPKASGGTAKPQDMSNFSADQWSNDSQLWWTGAKPGDTLKFPLPDFTGVVDLEIVLTCARDYGIVQLDLDGKPLGKPVDLYERDVVTTGVLKYPKQSVRGKQHTLGVTIVGANKNAAKSHMFALDYLRILKSDGSFVASLAKPPRKQTQSQATADAGILPKSTNGEPVDLGFETGSLTNWTSTGTAFERQPIKGDTVHARRNDMRSNHAGQFWIGGYEHFGDERVGTLSSKPFVVNQPYGSYLAAGGNGDSTRIELVRNDTGKVFFKSTGKQTETMQRIVVDLRSLQGKEIFVRLVDESRGGWGHVNFDSFRMHAKRPGRLASSSIALQPDEYPHAGLNAEAAAAAMRLPKGFQVKVGAHEPDVKQPIAMALDHRGRVWVAEAYEYPVRAEGDSGRDRILIFEDTDGDGALDSRKVFTEGLNLVSGLEVGFGGVWVGAAPYLMFIPDADGDDVPDSEPQVLLDGWGYQDTHETLNAFIWGPDGWLYGCHGVFTHSRVGKPGTPDDQRVPINCGVWRYHPTRHHFEVFAHGTSNPWGVDFDDHGQALITACVIPHLYHMIQGARYQRQGGQHFNPHTYRDIVTIADHLHYLGATPHSGNSKSDSAGGGHAHSGAMIYLGGHWPDKFRNQLLMNNIHGQRLNVDILEPEGSGFVGRHGNDFLLTGDQASQIMNLRYGPDGNAWMIDWYDMQACHRREVQAHDRSNGRIYKICYGESETSAPSIDLATATDLELAELVLRKNDWFVRHARRALQERASQRSIDETAIAFLASTGSDHADSTRRLRAYWALHVTGSLSSNALDSMFADGSPYVRAWGVQLMLESMGDELPEATREILLRLAIEDPSPIVRLYVASATDRIQPNQRWDLVTALTSHPEDIDDHNLPLMYWYIAEPLAAVDPSRALGLAMSEDQSIPLVREFMLRRIGSQGDAQSLSTLVGVLHKAESDASRLTLLKSIRASLEGRRQVTPPKNWLQTVARLQSSKDREVQLQTVALGVTFGDKTSLAAIRSRIADDALDHPTRRVALRSLLDAGDPELLPTLIALLRSEGELRKMAILGMAQYDAPDISGALLEAYESLPSADQRLALATLSARTEPATALLEAIKDNRLPAKHLSADLVRQMQFLRDKKVDQLLDSVWGVARRSPKEKLQLIDQYKQLVHSNDQPKPDAALGRAVYGQTCSKCHKLFGLGNKVGPDLTGSNRSNLDYLLSNIVDPSAVMAKEYVPTILLLDDGRVVNGLIQSEDQFSITLRTPDATVTVPKEEIERRTEAEASMMPEDQLKQFSPHQIRSLIAYLRSKSQVPIRATSQNATQLFNQKDLSGWTGNTSLWSVESGELVGKTKGLKHNDWIVSDLDVGDFHLSVDVKLIDNAGNSGIQFRSVAKDAEVSGYQADIGQDWWGKLYEEHGRGLLWKKSGEDFVKPDQWNRYEIICNGSQIKTLINGKICVDLNDPTGARRGILALQLHSGGATEVRFRHFSLKVLSE